MIWEPELIIPWMRADGSGWTMRSGDRHDGPFLVDQELAMEIRLLGEVIAAAGQHDGHLTVEELDEVIGMGSQREAPPQDQASSGL